VLNKYGFLTSTALVGSALFMFSGHAALAQTAPAAGQQADTVKEVVVTGSRIARRDYAASSPIVTVGQKALENTGAVTVETLLNQVPQFVPSVTSTSNNPSNGGQANVELRGLGTQRTLVLLDGRRMTPSNSDGTVDLNTVPDALIQNIEVITGGASTAYGSDAMAGVVNFKLNHRFSGVQFDTQYGKTSRNDGATQNAAVTVGGNFDNDRGNAVVSFGYSNREGIMNADRPFSAVSGLSPSTPYGAIDLSGNSPTQAAIDTAFAAYGVAAGTVPRNKVLGFNPDGKTLFYNGNHYLGSDAIDFGTIKQAGNYNTGALNLLTIPLTRYNAFGRTEYKVRDNVTAYAQFNYTTYESNTQLAPAPAAGSPATGRTGFWVPVTNPFVPNDLKPILASRGNPNDPFLFSTRFTAFGPRVSDNKYTVGQFVTGLNGTLGGDWTWDVYGSYGKENRTETQFGNVSHSAVRTLLEAADGGASLCAGGYNPFGMAPVSDACKAYVQRTTKNTTEFEQRIVEGNLQGTVFTLPAGDVKLAVGADYRGDKYSFIPDSLLSTRDVSGTGPYKTDAPGVVGFNAQNALHGAVDVKEVYAEGLIPLLSNLPFIKQLDLGLAGRYSDYSSVGGVKTYKADLQWKVNDWLFARGGYSRGVRAPSIGELYAPQNQNFPTVGTIKPTARFAGDPCDVNSGWRMGLNGFDAAKVKQICLDQGIKPTLIDTYSYSATQVQSTTGGNPDLKQETADTWSLGLVWTSRFDHPLLRKLRTSVDWYSIDIQDAIGSIGAGTIINNCFNGTPTTPQTNPTYSSGNYYCSLIHRDEFNGQIASVTDTLDNLGMYKTQGIDFQVDWGFGLDALGLDRRWGSLSLNVIGTKLRQFDVQSLPGGAIDHHLGTISNVIGSANPEWKALTSVAWNVGPFELGGRWRYIGEMDDFRVGGQAAPAYNYFDVSGRWKINSMLEVRGGVNNVGDKMPAVYTSSIQANTDPSTYDVLGRRWYLALRAKF
jgi:outer membrane receptor protein involved in Fe transport